MLDRRAVLVDVIADERFVSGRWREVDDLGRGGQSERQREQGKEAKAGEHARRRTVARQGKRDELLGVIGTMDHTDQVQGAVAGWSIPAMRSRVFSDRR